MGLRINTNVPALGALRTLQVTDRDQSRSLERLSTGLRINRGADDPSGLVVSEQLRGQLRALDQAVTNSQNASNMISTADAALAEVSDLLISIQDSIVFAQNTGGASKAQIAAEQDSVDQAIAAVDRIAGTTRFADRPLLNGTAGFNLVKTRLREVNDLKIKSIVFQGNQQARDLNIKVDRVPARSNINIQNSIQAGASGATVRISGSRGSEDISLAASASVTQIRDAINSVAGFTGAFATAVSGVATAQSLDIFSEDFGTSEFVRIEVTQGSIGASGGAATATVVRADGGTSAVVFATGVVDTLEIFADKGGDGAVLFQGQVFRGNGNKFNILNRIANIEFNLDPDLIDAGSIVAGTAPTSATFSVGRTGLDFQLRELARPTDRLSLGLQSVGASVLGFETINDSIESAIAGSTIKKGGFLKSVATGGPNDLFTSPRNAGNIINSAILEVARFRGFLGAIQADDLQPNIDSLGVAVQNLSASLSDLRDLDFAKETSEFTRSQIIFQSGIGVLASANQIPQSVLQLLRG